MIISLLVVDNLTVAVKLSIMIEKVKEKIFETFMNLLSYRK